jgi:hypothetical protein
VIEVFCLTIVPRAWGCETAQAGLWLCARLFLRAYLALHPHARLCFFGCFVVVVVFSALFGRFLCLSLNRSQFL